MTFLLLCGGRSDDDDVLVAVDSIACVTWEDDYDGGEREPYTKIVMRDQTWILVDHPVQQIADLLQEAGHRVIVPTAPQ